MGWAGAMVSRTPALIGGYVMDRISGLVGGQEANGQQGKCKQTRKPRATAARKPKVSRKALALQQVELWANRYVGAAVVLSAGLNGWASVDLSGAGDFVHQAAAAGIGAVVPGLVWIAGKVAGWSHRAGRKGLAGMVGSAGVCLLLLSIAHCSHAIAHLTGCGLALAGMMAVGIDYGLVASEVAAIVAHEDE